MYRKLRSSLLQLRDDRSGAAMVELALIAPTLALMTVGTIDYALLMTSKLSVENAARNGASYAVKRGFNSATISSTVTSSGRAASYLSAITANPAPTSWYGCANANTGVVSAASSTTTCTIGGTAGQYVTVTAQGTYTFLVHWPTLPANYPITAQVKVRIS